MLPAGRLQAVRLLPGLAGGLLQVAPRAALARSGARPAAACQAHQTAHASATAWKGANPPRVVVLGGGFGGLYAAVRLDQLLWPRGTKPQITLIDRSDNFVFKPLLYEVLNNTASENEVAPSFAQLLAPYPIRFIQAEVKSVEHMPSHGHSAEPHSPDASASSSTAAGAGSVVLSDGSTVGYDFLVVALGSQPDARGVPGVRERAVPFNTYEDAMTVKNAMDALTTRNTGGTVMVVGAGYSGVELATTLAEQLKRCSVNVQLVTPGSDVLDSAGSQGQRDSAREALVQLGVQLVTGARVKALEVPSGRAAGAAPALGTACCVQLEPAASGVSTSGSGLASALSVEADLVVWTAGSAPATKQARQGFPFPVTDRGAVKTEPTLRVQGEECVFALGDVALSAPAASSSGEVGQSLPATAQVAFQQADYAAWNLWAAINGRPLLPFRYQHLGNMMALGALNGAVALPVALPIPLVTGLQASPLGALLDTAGVKLGGAGPDNGVTIQGPLAALMRRAAYLYRQPTNEQRMGVASGWLQQAASSAAELMSRGSSR